MIKSPVQRIVFDVDDTLGIFGYLSMWHQMLMEKMILMKGSIPIEIYGQKLKLKEINILKRPLTYEEIRKVLYPCFKLSCRQGFDEFLKFMGDMKEKYNIEYHICTFQIFVEQSRLILDWCNMYANELGIVGDLFSSSDPDVKTLINNYECKIFGDPSWIYYKKAEYYGKNPIIFDDKPHCWNNPGCVTQVSKYSVDPEVSFTSSLVMILRENDLLTEELSDSDIINRLDIVNPLEPRPPGPIPDCSLMKSTILQHFT